MALRYHFFRLFPMAMAPISAASEIKDMTSNGRTYFDIRDLPSSGRLMTEPAATTGCHTALAITLIRIKKIAIAAEQNKDVCMETKKLTKVIAEEAQVDNAPFLDIHILVKNEKIK